MSWRHFQHVLSVTIFGLPRRRLAKASWRTSWICLQDLFKTSWKTKNCYAEDVFKTSWRHVLKTFSRRLGDKQNVYQGYLCLTNLNVYIFDLANVYLANLYLTNLMIIQLSSINNFDIRLILKHKQQFYFKLYVSYYTNIFKWKIFYTHIYIYN